jgi:site-specific recombinase XerC
MSEARISKLEESFNTMQVSFWKIETTLENIDRNLTNVLSVKEEVTTHSEKHKVTENRLLNLEGEQKEIGKNIASINLKIALVTWAWWVIFFLINHFISK